MRGAALRTIGFGVGLAASVLAARLVAQHLGPVDFGRFQEVIALTSMVQVVAEFGLTILGIREYSHLDGPARDHFMRVLLGLRIAAIAVGLIVTTGLAVLLGYDREMVIGTAFMVVGFGLSTLGARSRSRSKPISAWAS